MNSTDHDQTTYTFIRLTNEQRNLIHNVSIPLTSVSLILSFLSVLCFVVIRRYQPELADRVSFRLSAANNASDLAFSIFHILSVVWMQPTRLCSLAAWGWSFFSLLCIFYTVCIALNLQLIFIHEYKGRHTLEKYYYACPIILALLLSLLPFSQNMWGYDEIESTCWYRDSGKAYNFIWQGATFFGWILISILYGLSVVFVVFRKLRSATSQMNKTLDSLPITSPAKRQFLEAVKQRTLVSAVVQRLIWYPIIPAMTQLTNCVLEIQIYVTQVVSFRLLLICYIAASIQGTLNAIVFSRDMAMIRGFESLRIYWWKTYVNPFEEQYPKFSHNKSAYFQKETHREPEHSKTDLIELDDFDNNTRVNSRDLGASGMNQFNAHLNNNNPMYPSIPDFGSVLQDISSFDRVSLNIDLEAQDDEITESFPSVWEKIRYFLLITIIRAPSDHEKSFLNHPVKSPSTSTYIIPSDDTIQVPSRNESILNIYTRNENEQQTGLNHTLKPERFEKTLITSAAASTKTSQTKSLDSTISEDSAQSPSSANLHMKKSSFLGRIPSFKSLTDKTSSFNSIMPISPVATSTIDQSKKHRSSHWNRNAHSSKFDISGMLLSNDFGINSIPQNIHTSPKSSVLADEEIDDMESDYSPSLRSFYRQLRAFSNDIELTLKQL